MTEGSAATAAQFQLTEVNLPVLRESQTARAAVAHLQHMFNDSANNLVSMKSGSSVPGRLLPSRNSSRATISLRTAWWVRILGRRCWKSDFRDKQVANRGLPAG
jgi:hypothetical protein